MLESSRRTFAGSRQIRLVSLIALLVVTASTDLAAAPPPVDEATIAGLEAALQQRVATLEGIGDPSKSEKKELKTLAKGLKKFADYVGADTTVDSKQLKKDFKALGNVAGAVDKSKTTDPGLLMHVVAVRDTIDQVGLVARERTDSTSPLLMDAKALKKMDKFLAKGEKLRAKGLDKWNKKYSSGAAVLAAAAKSFLKAAALAVEQHVEEADENPNDARPLGVTLITGTPKINHPIVLDAQYTIDRPSPELTLALYANSVRSTADGGGGTRPATQWLIGHRTLTDVPAGPGSQRFESVIPLWMFRNEVDKTPPLPNTQLLGGRLAVDGDTVVVGSFATEAVIYERDEGGAGAWGQTAILDTGKQAPAMDLGGDTLVLGTGSNKVSIFERDEGGPGAWGKVKDLVPHDTTDDISFGGSVAISGDWIGVGASLADPFGVSDGGMVYLFERNTGGADAWGFRQTIVEPFGAQVDAYLGQVAIDGDLLVVGAPRRDIGGLVDTGEAHTYEFNPQSGFWHYGASLNAGHSADAYFGQSVAVDGHTIIVGAPGDTVRGVVNAGSARVLLRQDNGSVSVGPLLTSHNPASYDNFGSSVAIAKDTAVVGAPVQSVGNNSGSVFLFVRDQEGTNAWGQLERLSKPDSTFYAFGERVAADGDVIVCGAVQSEVDGNFLAGSAHIYGGMEPIIEGDYTFALDVDPDNPADGYYGRILERPLPAAEDNNDLSDIGNPVLFEGEAVNKPNLELVSVELSPDQIFVDTSGRPIASFGVNITVAMTGNFDGPLSGVRLYGGMEIPGILPEDTNVMFWDPKNEVYVDSSDGLPLPDLVTGETLTMHVDLSFDIDYPTDESEVYEVELGFEALGPITLTEVHPDGGDPYRDNLVIFDEVICNVIHKPQCTYSVEYEKRVGNDEFGAGIDFASSIDLTKSISGLTGVSQETAELYPDSEAEVGLVAGAHGGVDITVFGFDVDLVDFRMLVERDPVDNYGFMGSDLVYLDPSTLKKQVVYSVGPYDTVDLHKINPKKFPDGFDFDSEKGEISLTKTFEKKERREKKPKKPVFLGPIPIVVEGAVEGGVGFEMKLTVGNALVAEAYPFARLFGTVEVDVGGIGLAGAEGKLTVVDYKFRSAAGLGMTVVEQGSSKAIGAAMCYRVSNELQLLNGKLVLFARYPTIRWCDAGFFDVPCGVRIRKATHTLVDWTAFQLCNILLEDTLELEDLCCETLTEGPPVNCSNENLNAVCATEECE